MRILELLHHLNIPYMTEGHKHCRPGWANMPCPFCTGNPGMHLGVEIEHAYFQCWRCGSHRTGDALTRLSGQPLSLILELMRQFGGKSRLNRHEIVRAPRRKNFKWPTGTGPLTAGQCRYLEKRKFDPDRICYEWDLKGTGPVALLDGIDYKHRILAPITWKGTYVSFQGRTTADVQPKYKACPKDRELYHHQHILYGKPEEWTDEGICVEGITDVWRFGPRAFAVFGIEYTLPQIREIARAFKRVAVVFDDDPQAVIQAHKLIAELRMRGVDAWWVPIIGDPGGMTPDDADAFVKDLF